MSKADEKAKNFLQHEQAFRLGVLLTESAHPKTKTLSQTAQKDLLAATRMLQSVDCDIPPITEKVFNSTIFEELVDSFLKAMQNGNRIFFAGCGATGRLSILLDAAWRFFWQQLKKTCPDITGKSPDMENLTSSIIAGGDFALIKSVEGFEDFTDFGRFQLKEAGVKNGDVVTAITEGGETSFVIGTAWQGLNSGAKVFFVYNNPTDILKKHVERSRQIIEEDQIKKMDLATGPMAITGSTRMQATTSELLVVGSALEMALIKWLRKNLPKSPIDNLNLVLHRPAYYQRLFTEILSSLSSNDSVDTMKRFIEFEEDIYRKKGLVTYFTDYFLLDVLTDTTERSPTFMVPPFKKNDNTGNPIN